MRISGCKNNNTDDKIRMSEFIFSAADMEYIFPKKKNDV